MALPPFQLVPFHQPSPLLTIPLEVGTVDLGRLQMVKYGIPSTLLNYLSRKHLRLEVSEDGVSVTALASMQDTNDLIRINPTPGADAKTPVLDGHALAKGAPSRLNAGDSIVLLAGATQSTVGCGEELLYVLRTSVSSPSSSKSLNSAD